MDSGTKPDLGADRENQEMVNENVAPTTELVVNKQVSEKSKRSNSKRKWLVVGGLVLIVIALVVLYLAFGHTKKTNKSTSQTNTSSGINNLSQLKAARDKLTSVVQPISNDTSKLESLK